MSPRLVAAHFVFADGTDQIARDQLFDRALESLCTPTTFSNGSRYCEPPTNEAFYTDEHCSHVMGRVPDGAPTGEFFATTYGQPHSELPSRVFRTGPRGAAPALRWVKWGANQCVAYPVEHGYSWYEVGEEVDLATVRLEPWFHVGEYVVDAWKRSDGLLVPTTLENCELPERPNQPSIDCLTREKGSYVLFADADCSTPVVLGYRPSVTFVHDDITDCTSYFVMGERVPPPAMFYQRIAGTCVTSSEPSSPELFITAAMAVDVPKVSRVPIGSTRIQLIHLRGLPLFDDLVHDTQLATDCRRDAQGRCLPATDATVETWFADAACGTPIDVAMVRAGGCNPPITYAQRAGTFYPVGDPYPDQLYQLEPGDRCGIYNPPAPFVAHSIGPALGDEAFARATLMIE